MRRIDVAIPSGLIGLASTPVLLYRNGQPFIPFTSYPQFLSVLAIVLAVGIGALMSIQLGLKPYSAVHAALIGGAIGAAVGVIPSLIGGMPYGLNLNSPRPTPWAAFTRSNLIHSDFKKIETEWESEKETWIPTAPWWRVWPNQNVVMTIGENEVCVTGPRSMIMPLSRNWKRIQALGPS
jgi:hypothetical protein